MAVPKRKTAKSNSRSRRAANIKKTPVTLVTDSTTGNFRMSHRVDPETGMYKGKQIIEK